MPLPLLARMRLVLGDLCTSKAKWLDKHTLLAPLLVKLPPTTLLDVGAGDGRIARWFKRLHPTARVVVADTKFTGSVTDLEAYITDTAYLPFVDQEFDTVISLFTASYIQDRRLHFQELFRVAKEVVIFGESIAPRARATKLARHMRIQDWLAEINPIEWTLTEVLFVGYSAYPAFYAVYQPLSKLWGGLEEEEEEE